MTAETIGTIVAIVAVLFFGSLLKRPDWQEWKTRLLIGALSVVGAVVVQGVTTQRWIPNSAELGQIFGFAQAAYWAAWKFLPLEQALSKVDLIGALFGLTCKKTITPPTPTPAPVAPTPIPEPPSSFPATPTGPDAPPTLPSVYSGTVNAPDGALVQAAVADWMSAPVAVKAGRYELLKVFPVISYKGKSVYFYVNRMFVHADYLVMWEPDKMSGIDIPDVNLTV